MGLEIKIGVTGGTELSRILAVQSQKIKDLRPAWDQIEKSATKMQERVFRQKGGADGLPKWAQLAASTIRQKKRIAPQYANYPLIRTGALRDAWTRPNAQGAVRIKEPLLFAFGINERDIEYAKWHQTGTRRMPKREHLRLTESMRRSIVKTIQAHIVKSGQFARETIFTP